MRPNPAKTTETRFLGSISASSIRNLLPKSMSSKHKLDNANPKIFNFNSENTPPIDPNVQIDGKEVSASVSKQSDSVLLKSQQEKERTDGHREPSSILDPPLKEGIAQLEGEVSVPSDPPVKVVVRIKPSNGNEREGDRTVRKVSSDTLSLEDRKFTFDSVFDSNSKQEDIFRSIGVPLVKNALAGYNTSLLSYGQTGSGKTYTMWGPPSSMVESLSLSSNQGIVPRIFQMLFSEIQKEQENSDGKQINYQCRCSFLEIYNEKIGDLLDPTQRNLEIKDDPKTVLYLENLTEEYVTSYEDVAQILIKGLSSRKVGATTVNSKSSRSHIVFTFIIESWCKGTSSKCFGSSKTSRISLIDLAGLDRNIGNDAGKQSTRECKNVKKSLSRLGHLVNTLSKGTQSGQSGDALYRGSSLTHLLRESLGGNAMLTVICAISPDNCYTGETLRTLRFGQRLKSIKNKPVINEISEDDVNDLSDQICQLKEELIRAKSNVCTLGGSSNNGYFQGRNVRESLNQLRLSLNRSLILPQIDNDSDEEVKFDEEDVKELRQQLDKLHGSGEENLEDSSAKRESLHFSSVGQSFDTDLATEDDISCTEESEIEETSLENPNNELTHEDNPESEEYPISDTARAIDHVLRSISISPHCRSHILEDPPLSESPRIANSLRKSMVISTDSVHQNKVSESSRFKSDIRQSLNQSDGIRSSLQSNKIFLGPTESLEASLQRGLKIIDNHQRNSASNKSLVAFSFEHLALKPCPEIDKADAPVQTLQEEKTSIDGPSSSSYLCTSCRRRIQGHDDTNYVQDSFKTWMIAEEANPGQVTNQMPKEVEQYKNKHEIVTFEGAKSEGNNPLNNVNEHGNRFFDVLEKEALLKEIESLKGKLQSYTDVSAHKSSDELRSSLLLSRSIQLRKSGVINQGNNNNSEEELERERERWTEMESEWISLTDDLRMDLESNRRRAEKVQMELRLEKKCTEELDDALHRAVLGHGRMIEHYAELQDKYNDLAGRYRAIMEGIAEVKRAATKAGAKGHGSRFAKSLAAELSALRVERERERELLKKENKSLRIQLRDTAEAVHAAGELLVRLREAEQAASGAEKNFTNVQQENEKLKKQMEKLKRKHKMEMVTMKQYLAESRLPASALQSMYQDDEDAEIAHEKTVPFSDDDQAWRAEFGAIYQDHY